MPNPYSSPLMGWSNKAWSLCAWHLTTCGADNINAGLTKDTKTEYLKEERRQSSQVVKENAQNDRLIQHLIYIYCYWKLRRKDERSVYVFCTLFEHWHQVGLIMKNIYNRNSIMCEKDCVQRITH